MSKWIWVTHESGERSIVNSDVFAEISRRSDEEVTKLVLMSTDPDGEDTFFGVKETPEELYAMIHGLPLAYLDHIRAAVVIEAHEQELYRPVQRTKSVTDAEVTWESFADAVVERLREVRQ